MKRAASSSGVLINPPAETLGSVNAIYSGRARRHLVENYAGPLSLKTMISGAAFWHTAAGAQCVRASSFLVLNKGTNYTLEMNSREPSHTFVLFFKDGFVEDVQRCLNASAETLLDEPRGDRAAAEFVEAIHSAGASAVGAALGGVRRVWERGGSADALEEEFRRVAVELVRLQNEVARMVSATPSVRSATRHELFRRIQRARVLMDDTFTAGLGLDEVAAEACLSPHHFHRTFRGMLGVTPHQYVVGLRLKQAARLLRETELPVATICTKSGFESVPSFTTLFRARFRVPPSGYRRLTGKSKIR